MAIEKNLTPEQQAYLDGQTSFNENPDPNEGVEPTITEDEDGGATVEYVTEDEEIERAMVETEHDANLADVLPDEVLEAIAGDLVGKIEDDDESRADWLLILKDAIKLLGLKIEKLSEPFEGACAATHPLLLESITKFQAKSYVELFPSTGPVKTKIMGKETPQRMQQQNRVKEFMNFEVLDLMEEYGPELDRLLFNVALAGSAFKKTYLDSALDRPVSRYVSAEDFIVQYHATDLQTCERYTHRMSVTENMLRSYQLNGFYRDVELGDAPVQEVNIAKSEHDRVEGKSQGSGEDQPHTFYECHTVYDIEGFEHLDEFGEPTGLALPYIITIDKDSKTILSIRRNWKEGDLKYKKLLHFTHYQFVPGLGFYGYGYLHLIGGLARTATSSMRQLVDAGTFANLPAGFKAHGLRVVGDDSPLQPGEFRDVNAPSMDLAKSIIPLPFKEPSLTLFNLLQFIVTAAEKFADSTEALVSEAKTYGPVGTVMALLEQGGKLFSAIHKRLHAAQGLDFKILARINGEWLDEEYPYETEGNSSKIMKTDFDGRIDVIPVSDPNMPTQSHRIAKANAIFSIAAQLPQEHDMKKVLYKVYESMGLPNPAEYLKAPPQAAQPSDPITENQNALLGTPLAVGQAQNHVAHIKTHFTFSQLPAVQQNPFAIGALNSHIQEHVASDYRVRIQNIMGMELPPPGTPMSPEMENKVAIAAAEATKQMLAEDIMSAAAADPSTQTAMAAIEVEREKNETDKVIKLLEIGLDEKKMHIDDENEDADRAAKLAIAKLQSNTATNVAKLKPKPKPAGAKK